MDLKFSVAALVLVALSGCSTSTVSPITEEMFVQPYPNQQQTGVTGTLEPASTVVTTPLVEGGVDPSLALVEEDPYGTVVEGGAGGLTERLPDTCRLALYEGYKGQSRANIEAAGLTVPYRVVGPTDIVTQEYNPVRVNFYVGSGGNVDRIICG